ncbi:MAG: SEC-C domain-containing protein, partial [Nitrososphaera sp.]|nr:SEC-C domain-containing protein [Nitrososphaera sp.]
WGERSVKHLNVKADVEVDETHVLSMRMVDYVQSIIASVPPAEDQLTEIEDQAWEILSTKVNELFKTINSEYQICRRAASKAKDPDFNESFEEFQFKAQFYWCNVRGSRYQVHDPAYLRDMFQSHSEVILELFGISANDFIEELCKIWHALPFGLGEAIKELDAFRMDSLNAIEVTIKSGAVAEDASLSDLMTAVVTENRWQARRDRELGRFLGMDLFNVEKTTNLPKVLLEELTWSQGEDTEFFATGEFQGWPLRIWPIFKRPFIKLNGQYYCFELSSLFDHIYRVMQRVICKLKPDYRETWNKLQQEVSEQLPIEYFKRLLPSARILSPVYYQWTVGDGGRREWCEADALLYYDDHLFVIEARGGAFTYTSPALDFPAYVASIRNLVLKPATQGNRFLEYLNSADAVALFDSDHRQICGLRRADFRHVTICPITLDPFTEIAAQVQHLRKIGVDVGTQPVWAVSVDDLRAYADIFENPLVFLHFVEQRMRAFRSDAIQTDDEMDHVGLYLKHNNYSVYAQEMQEQTSGDILFHGYRSDVDTFFSNRLIDPQTPCPLRQSMPRRLQQVIDFLEASDSRGRAELSSFLLDLAGEWRHNIFGQIGPVLREQRANKRPKPLSTYGETGITIFCWQDGCIERSAQEALHHSQMAMILGNESERWLLELVYTESTQLRDVSWRKEKLIGISEPELARLQVHANGLRQARIASVKLKSGKIGRNQLCPCGSGKKYKKCCLGR